MVRRMCALLLLLSQLFGAERCQSPPGRKEMKTDGRAIIGGEGAMPGQFPFVVSISAKERKIHMCGGSIIAPAWILTAAHCFREVDDPKMLAVLAGTVKLSEGGELVDVKRIIQYNPYVIAPHDIALVELKRPLKYGEMIQPIKLPLPGEEAKMGLTCYVIGWGYTQSPNPTGEASNDLKYVDITIFPTNDCRQMYHPENEDFSKRICAGTQFGGKDSCVGDSGGPLVANGKQIGIVSYGDDVCGSMKGRVAVYTKVSAYVTWIRSYIN